MKLLFILLLGLGFTQTKLETRIYETDYLSNYINLSDYIGFESDFYIFKVLKLIDSDCDADGTLMFESAPYSYPNRGAKYTFWGYYQEVYWDDTNNNEQIFYHPELSIIGPCTSYKFLFSITAEFPEEDTGYIEEGYQFCVQPGANLLSFPCDNPISVNQSLPQGAENFITQIVGQGVATTYNPALGWVGSLDNFSPGSGYWFKSNESLCFEYDCVEN